VITKKKLEFAGRKLIEETKKEVKPKVPAIIISDSDESDNETEKYDSLNDSQLTELLESRRKQLQILQRHQKEKQQLLEYKEKWKEAGNESLEILTGYYKMSREELLHKMGLDDDVFD
jgi:hypothetical protein